MRLSPFLETGITGFLLAVVGCDQAHPEAAATARMHQEDEADIGPREELSVEDRLCEIAARLRSGGYTVVGGWNRANASCIDWGRTLNFSDAASRTPHSMKIYQPWARDAKAYFLAAEKNQPVGQVIVKESWMPNEAAAEAITTGSALAERDGKKYMPDEPSELFIMFKDDPATPDTDEGWVYGIVTPDGKQVISSGRIASCVERHRQARHDRVFGAKPKAQ